MLILGGEVDMEMGRPPSDEIKREKETFFERDLARVDRLKPGEENLLHRLHKMRIRGRAFDVADRPIVGIGGDEDMLSSSTSIKAWWSLNKPWKYKRAES